MLAFPFTEIVVVPSLYRPRPVARSGLSSKLVEAMELRCGTEVHMKTKTQLTSGTLGGWLPTG